MFTFVYDGKPIEEDINESVSYKVEDNIMTLYENGMLVDNHEIHKGDSVGILVTATDDARIITEAKLDEEKGAEFLRQMGLTDDQILQVSDANQAEYKNFIKFINTARKEADTAEVRDLFKQAFGMTDEQFAELAKQNRMDFGKMANMIKAGKDMANANAEATPDGEGEDVPPADGAPEIPQEELPTEPAPANLPPEETPEPPVDAAAPGQTEVPPAAEPAPAEPMPQEPAAPVEPAPAPEAPQPPANEPPAQEPSQAPAAAEVPPAPVEPNSSEVPPAPQEVPPVPAPAPNELPPAPEAPAPAPTDLPPAPEANGAPVPPPASAPESAPAEELQNLPDTDDNTEISPEEKEEGVQISADGTLYTEGTIFGPNGIQSNPYSQYNGDSMVQDILTENITVSPFVPYDSGYDSEKNMAKTKEKFEQLSSGYQNQKKDSEDDFHSILDTAVDKLKNKNKPKVAEEYGSAGVIGAMLPQIGGNEFNEEDRAGDERIPQKKFKGNKVIESFMFDVESAYDDIVEEAVSDIVRGIRTKVELSAHVRKLALDIAILNTKVYMAKHYNANKLVAINLERKMLHLQKELNRIKAAATPEEKEEIMRLQKEAFAQARAKAQEKKEADKAHKKIKKAKIDPAEKEFPKEESTEADKITDLRAQYEKAELDFEASGGERRFANKMRGLKMMIESEEARIAAEESANAKAAWSAPSIEDDATEGIVTESVDESGEDVITESTEDMEPNDTVETDYHSFFTSVMTEGGLDAYM